ncbi:MAG: hypothetical protein ETSY1_46130 (plasmid) [Candidatus Entotheonella factor]|uniref:Uncharacterized protein n=2 Tax=Bacteria TaxID=2 RepID=W4M0U0_ENTF1|nr:OnnF [symbiont bacterium of Theonella swinhoei]ETX03780.1 MAG: hypothetical protein ETSY1_46130 [Candidatus Entotheonella factor]
MYNIFKDKYFKEYYSNGFVETDTVLSHDLVDEIRAHYQAKAEGHNDFPKFFVNNEHQIYLEGEESGRAFSKLPKSVAHQKIRELYDTSYSKAVYCEQVFMERVMTELLEKDFLRFFKTPYLIVSYDIYLTNDCNRPGAGIHTDPPNFHHFYETENDVTIYIPLVDLNDKNGGRISVLPESKLKLSGNVLLKMMEEAFGGEQQWLDENGYIDPDKIDDKALSDFIKSRPYQRLIEHQRNVISMARQYYTDEFTYINESKGRVLLWNNKNFHAAEAWKEKSFNREVYIIRCMPIYNTKIKLKNKLHGKLFNNLLVHVKTGTLEKFDREVDVSQIPEMDKVAI